MTKILLVCNLGMSTSMLVQKMEKEAVERGIEVDIAAVPIRVAENEYKSYQIIMLGPQVRHEYKGLKAKIGDVVPIEIINMRDYGTMNGKNVLDAALKVIAANQ